MHHEQGVAFKYDYSFSVHNNATHPNPPEWGILLEPLLIILAQKYHFMQKRLFNRLVLILILAMAGQITHAQNVRNQPSPVVADTSKRTPPKPASDKPGPKPYKEVITDKAKTDDGFFVVHKVDDKYYFEIPDSLFDREWLVCVRVAKTSNGIGYGGEEQNRQTLKWEKTPDNKVLLRSVSFFNVSNDENPISKAVKQSNSQAIVGAFDIKAFSKDSTGVVIELTDYIKEESPVFTVTPGFKRNYGLAAQISDRSFITSIKSFPKNTEIRTTRTYATAPVTNPNLNITDANNVGVVTLELNTSMVMLPKVPMKRRFADARVGYFTNTYTNYGLDAQRSESETFIRRWRLEPKPEDVGKMKRGELVEPANQIVYYIDPATPVKWRKYLKLGIEDWNKCFEKAGFKNAIAAKDFPEHDSTASTEDIRFSMIRYFASDIPNAYGPQTFDPRSGEVLQSQVGWYHNVMQLLRDWYLIQAAAVDPEARHVKLSDELMGQLIRFVSSHEIGHTLGLLHNFGSSSTTPVENLRNKEWVEANGHTPSIMDYARFNYVAQPEDNISQKGIFPRIGDYDDWAIEFGYKLLFDKNEYEEKPIMNALVKERLKNKRLLYLMQRAPYNPNYPDPRAQNEDIGDNAMLAGEYGIKNLKRILPNLTTWLREEGENYDQIDEVYTEVRGQYMRYINHVLSNVGGVYETPRTQEQDGGDIFVPVPKAKQLEAMDFLKRQIFTTPTWLVDYNIQKQFNQDQVVDEVRNALDGFVGNLLHRGRFARFIDNTAMLANKTYMLEEYIADLRKNIYSEVYQKKSTDWYKRLFQKIFVERVSDLLANPPTVAFPPGLSDPKPRRTWSRFVFGQMDFSKSDVPSVLKACLRTLRNDIKLALLTATDNMTKFHYQDILDRIETALSTEKK